MLQAADILLLYDADVVPVGQDQRQHLEITRDIAGRFNNVYGETFKLPNAYILDTVAVISGIDGRKMSKSYDNTIEIFDDPKTILKKCKKIVTDSTPVEAPKNPDTDNLFQLFKVFAPSDQVAEVEARYRSGGIGYGEVKTRLAEQIGLRFAEPRERRAELVANPDSGPGSQPGRRREGEVATARVVPRSRPGNACGLGLIGSLSHFKPTLTKSNLI